MMRVAALYDIHGNLPALDAVLAELPAVHVTHLVIGGDVFPGPLAAEVLDRLRQLDLPISCIRGNGDREVLSYYRTRVTSVPDQFAGVIRWHAGQLAVDHANQIASWPERLSMDVPELGRVLFCHATPRSDTEIFTRLTTEETIAPAFADTDESLVICGHTHAQFDRRVGRHRIVNAGSVGMPFGATGAYWLLLGPSVELRTTQYDLQHAAARIRESAYPGADTFAANNVLTTPAADVLT